MPRDIFFLWRGHCISFESESPIVFWNIALFLSSGRKWGGKICCWLLSRMTLTFTVVSGAEMGPLVVYDQ